ncbi:MAG: hypothetical protein BWY06_01266 [Candidatus Latescibacteria bacterium ADurb.Bin168]|nr:MAG: hypothetical protein BWY06_01266 [Candidatus Latescibacteria bacterium ADurb.Bin168]
MTLRDMESGEQRSFATIEAVAARVLDQRDDHRS